LSNLQTDIPGWKAAMRHIFMPLIGAALTLCSIPAVAAPSGPVVVELFTSQGCSSCPPADKLLAALAKRPDIIAITRPVTYWDRLGWKDTLARPENTQLQYDYAKRLKRDGVYTPQVVVQGRTETIGSRAAALEALVQQARAASPLRAARQSGTRVQLLWQGPRPTQLQLHLLRVMPASEVKIGHGENGGTKIIYTNVVLEDVLILPRFVADGTMTITVPSATPQARFALLANTGAATSILAASWLD
jgi:hypothetical protein